MRDIVARTQMESEMDAELRFHVQAYAEDLQVCDILQLIVVHGMRLALIGVAIGMLAALTIASLMQGQLFGVSANDPSTLIAVTALLLFVGLLACYGPARRATRVDPLVALRCE
jgi:putative ABC transport system permease protein